MKSSLLNYSSSSDSEEDKHALYQTDLTDYKDSSDSDSDTDSNADSDNTENAASVA
jgi:hypothetical protein